MPQNGKFGERSILAYIEDNYKRYWLCSSFNSFSAYIRKGSKGVEERGGSDFMVAKVYSI